MHDSAAIQKHVHLLSEVNLLEVELGITSCWHSGTPKYIDAVKYIAERLYHRALNNLQWLVVQHLFELHKLNISQTGM